MIYDSREHIFPATILNGRGHRTRMAFHPGLGVAGLVEDLNGAVTALYYDGFGRLRSHKAPGGDDLDVNYLVTCGVLPMAAPPLSNCFRETHAAGPEITTAYDVLGRPVVENTLARADGKRVVTETYYDGLGRLARLSRRRFESDTAVYTTYEYDNLGRILAESRPDGTSTRA